MSAYMSERKNLIANISLAGITALGSLPGCTPTMETKIPQAKIATPQPKSYEQLRIIPDLRLNIDETGFWQAVKQPLGFGIITETWDRNKMDCLKPLGDFCIAEASPSFRVALNRPMIDFIFQQADLLNPSLPTRMIFTEDWPDRHSGTAGYVAISDDQKDQVIVVSLKAAALTAFRDLDGRKLSLDNFNGALSYFVSMISVHGFAQAGAQTKMLDRRGMLIPPEDILADTRPQIDQFQNKYIKLYEQALNQNLGDRALIFVVNPDRSLTDLNGYRAKLYAEARQLQLGKLKFK